MKRSSSSRFLGVFSAYVANSDVLVANIARLHFPGGAEILDSTYGRGVWWRRIAPSRYKLTKADLRTGHDARNSDYPDESFHVVCFDPPFLRGTLTTYLSLARFRTNYRLNSGMRQSHDDLLRFYSDAAVHAMRLLKRGGIFLVKCQDEVADGRPRATHVELLVRFVELGFRFRDLFVQVQRAPPRIPLRNRNQRHARKNHSFYLLVEKPTRNRRPRPILW